MHKLNDASFTYKDQNDKTVTVKGGLFVDTDTPGDDDTFNADSNLGPVVFRTAPLSDAEAEKKASQ
jgi:hypothetical protein